jgi:hypothetical protein
MTWPCAGQRCSGRASSRVPLAVAGASFGQLEYRPHRTGFRHRASGEVGGGFQRAWLDPDPFNIELGMAFSDVPAAFRYAVVVITHVAATAKPAAVVLRCCNGCHAPL